MIDKYEKLVRDKIPEIIQKQGDIPITMILDDENYFAALNQKLQEEVSEYLEKFDIDELADIVDVVMAIALYKGISEEDLQIIRLKKQSERGGFSKRIHLIEVERH